ncbi:MAG: DUF309 domain-containing protein [Planctomycetota bacterium]|nr:DUF309 domain-containing protein [Planctomycetota bacterium]
MNLPRYNPEAPIPAIPYQPGKNQRDPLFQITHETPSPDWKTDASFLHGVDLFNHRCYWEAHEAWEHRWLPLVHDDPLRIFLQGLIQASASLLKVRLEAPDSATTIWHRGRTRLQLIEQDCPSGTYQGVQIAKLITSMDQIVTHKNPIFDAPFIELLGWN